MSQFIEMFSNCSERKSLCSICRPKQWPTIPTKDFTEDGYLVYGANGVIGHYTEYNHENPTILMACRGASCGAINISRPKSYITGNAMCLDELSEEVKFEYLAFFLSQFDYKTIITGGAQPQITYTNLKKVDVPIPAIELQCEFVKIFQQADKSEFDGCKSQFIEMIGSKEWPQVQLKDIVHKDCPISYGIVQPGDDLEDGVPIVRPVDMNDTHLIDIKNLKHTSKQISDSYSRTILRGDEILVCVRGTTGLIALADGLKGCNVTRGITPLYFKPQYNREYIFRAFLGEQIQDYIQANTIGSTLKGINMSKLRELPICLPPQDIQEQYVSIAEQADKSESVGQYRIAC